MVVYDNATFSICCPYGYYYYENGDAGFICEETNFSDGCMRMKLNNLDEVVCETCKEGYYLSQDHCCPDNQAWSSVKKACTPIYVPELHNCLEN